MIIRLELCFEHLKIDLGMNFNRYLTQMKPLLWSKRVVVYYVGNFFHSLQFKNTSLSSKHLRQPTPLRNLAVYAENFR